jgi:hypothetical protein
VGGSNHGLQELQLLVQTCGPAKGELFIVEVLRCDSGDPSELALRIEDLEEVNAAQVPVWKPSLDDGLERTSGRAVATSSVEVDDLDVRHRAASAVVCIPTGVPVPSRPVKMELITQAIEHRRTA